MRRLPIRARLTAIFAGLLAVVLTSLSLFLFFDLRSSIDRSIDTFLRIRAASEAAQLRGQTPSDTRVAPNSDQVFIGVIGSRGRELSSTFPGPSGLIPELSRLRGIQNAVTFESTLRTDGEPLDARFYAMPTGWGQMVVVASSLEERQATLDHLAALLWIVIPGILVAATVIVWLLAGAALKPVDRLRTEAEAISGSDPARRLTVSPSGDEIERLARTLNELLERTESAVLRERRFVNDASHELRTPLAILRTEIDLALGGARSTDRLRAALASVGQEADRLSRVAEDLLVLARSEDRSLSVTAVSTDVEALVAEVIDDFTKPARDQHVALRARVEIDLVELDPIWIRQALQNLITNALRQMPFGGKAEVHVVGRDGDVLLSVSDTGEGFDEASLEDVFEPFSRPDSARARGLGGAGLGLAIVRAVATAHGGSVEARNRDEGGAVVSLRIPNRSVDAAHRDGRAGLRNNARELDRGP